MVLEFSKPRVKIWFSAKTNLSIDAHIVFIYIHIDFKSTSC